MSALLVKKIIFREFSQDVHFDGKSFKDNEGHTVNTRTFISGNSTKAISDVDLQPFGFTYEVENTQVGHDLKDFLIQKQKQAQNTEVIILYSNGNPIVCEMILSEQIQTGNDSSSFSISLKGNKKK